MIVRIKLLSDGIFGSGQSVPGMEDISVIHDEYGFPYLSGTNFKGNLREAVENILSWTGRDVETADRLFGKRDDKGLSKDTVGQIVVSDFYLPLEVRQSVLKEFHIETPDDREKNAELILSLFSEIWNFTALEGSVAKEGSLRMARCILEGLVFYGAVDVPDEKDEDLIEEALGQIKWLGSMRTRGFGQVAISSWKEIQA